VISKKIWGIYDVIARVVIRRLTPAIHALSLAWKESSKFLEEAVDPFPAIGLRSLRYITKRNVLADFFGLASDATALSLGAGDSEYLALQLLGRVCRGTGY
jgi:hypothetical protein